MPKRLHEALKRAASKKRLTGERRNRYIYGTLYKAMKGQHGEKRKQ